MGMADVIRVIREVRLLPPRDREFYVLFDELCQTLVDASARLIELFNCAPQRRSEIQGEIERLVTSCNRVTFAIEELLHQAQQPPFDRADIGFFADSMLRAMKFIDHAANRFVIYDFPFSDKEMREMAPIVHQACSEIARAVKALPKNRRIESYCRSIDLLEAKADDIYHEGLRRRFQEISSDRLAIENRIKALGSDCKPTDILSVLEAHIKYTHHVAVFFILRQVYAELERAIDALTEVAAVLYRMVAKSV